MFNATYQTYGRKVELEFMDGSGMSNEEVPARADAVKAMEEMGAFAVWGGPILSPAWTEEIQARGGVCLGCPAVSDAEPSVFGIVPSARQTRIHLVEYLDKKLNGKPAIRSEEHTSELQSLMRISYAVLCLKTKNDTDFR